MVVDDLEASGGEPAGLTPTEFSRTLPLMGGTARITVVGGTETMLDDAIALADRCEARWSRFIPTSDLSRLNDAQGAPVGVDPLTIALIGAMREGTALTAGDYSPTLLPQVIAAGYSASATAPDLITLLPAGTAPGGDLADIRIDGTTVRLPPLMTLDAGGIGKGLAADLVVTALLDAGAAGALAEIGGDIAVAGRAPDRIAWRLAVEDPWDPTTPRALVRIPDGALVTSSQRKRRFPTSDGERHHLIDPRTGTSAITDVQTVSVVAVSGARAEAIAKSGFLRPLDSFLRWVPTVGAAALVIDADGRDHRSSNWADYA